MICHRYKPLITREVDRFRHDCSGAIAMLFGLILVPILLIIGLAIDYAMAMSYQTSIQKTLDEAAIAGASDLRKSGEVPSAIAAVRRRFAATKPNAYPVELEVSVDPRRRIVTVDASAKVPMTFMALAGYKTLPVSAHAEAAVGRGNQAKRQRRSPALAEAAAKLSDQDISDLLYRVQAMCGQLQQLGYADRVPQCRAVLNGSFEQQLRAELNAGGNAQSLLPDGVSLVR
jgi:Flp pilus assembly protein TadG